MTKFEIVNQWNRVQKDFCQVEPLAGAFLDGTALQRGDFNTSPFPIKLIFRPEIYFQYEQFAKNSHYVSSLRDYLETILQTRVDLVIEQPVHTAASINSQNAARQQFKTSPAAAFERDKEREAILAFLEETFETIWQGTRSLAQSNRQLIQEPSSEQED